MICFTHRMRVGMMHDHIQDWVIAWTGASGKRYRYNLCVDEGHTPPEIKSWLRNKYSCAHNIGLKRV